MTGLRLGPLPLLRHADGDAGEARCVEGSGGSVRTFRIAGYHYALARAPHDQCPA